MKRDPEEDLSREAPGSSLGLNLDALDGQSLIISAIKMGPIRRGPAWLGGTHRGGYNERQEDEDLMLQHSPKSSLCLALYNFYTSN